MQTPGSIGTQLNCTQCGGELNPDEGQVFLTCPFCSSTVYVDKTRVVFHWSVAPTLNEQQAVAALYRWMSGSQTVKDLDKKAKVEGQQFEYFPLWYFKWKESEKEVETLRPAAATSVTELSQLKIPAGDLLRYDPALDAQAVTPTVPLEAALQWLGVSAGAIGSLPAGAGRPAPTANPASAAPAAAGAPPDIAPGFQVPVKANPSPFAQSPAAKPAAAAQAQGADVREAAVVHVPLYFYKYSYGGKSYTAVVDAASGGVLASVYPPKAEAPYQLIAAVTAIVYLCLATFPLIGAVSGSASGASTGLLICGGVGLLAAPLLFAWAFWVASKV